MDAARSVWGKRATEQAAEQEFVRMLCRDVATEIPLRRHSVLLCIGAVGAVCTGGPQTETCAGYLLPVQRCAIGCSLMQQEDAKKGQPWQRFDRDRDLQVRTEPRQCCAG